MAKNFFFRLVTLFFIMFGFSFLFLILLIFPSYFLLSLKESSVEQHSSVQKKELSQKIDQKAIDDFKKLNSQLSVIEEARGKKFSVSQKVINEIVLQKMSDIKITQISYENDAKSGQKVNIRGLAPSRERLLLFRLALENNIAFKKVDLPISNFVKGSNIQFSISLIPS